MLTRIDEAFLSKVKKWFPNTIYANTAIVYNTAYQLVDNPTLELKFPLISIYRPEGFSLVPTQTLSAKRRGYKYFQGGIEDNVARYLSMNLIYQLDIYAKTPEVLNKITTNLMYAFTLDPTLKIIQDNEYDPEAPFIDEYEINYNNGASEHSEFQSGDRIYHYAIAYEIKNAKLYNFAKEGNLIIDIEGNIHFIENNKISDESIETIKVALKVEWTNILNKPTFATVATSGDYADLTGKPDLDLKLDKNFSALPTQTKPLLTDVLVLNRGTTVQKVTLDNLLSQVDNEIFEVVSVLPTTGVANKIYLVPSDDPESIDNYVEWLWYDGAWERIGGISVDLSNYFTKTEINSMLDDKVDKNNAITAGTSPKITYDAKGLVTGGETLVAEDIPNLDASKINTGTFTADRIPSLEASKIGSGIFDAARIPNLTPTKITNLQTTLDTKSDDNSIIDGGFL